MGFFHPGAASVAATDIQAKAGANSGRRALLVVVIALACVAVALITVERAWLAAVRPLWFDEAWTVAVAATPDWRSLLDEAYNDVNAPLYYALMRLWTRLAGPSDFALRAPALLALLAAGAVPIASRIKGLSLEARLAWGAMVFGWWGVGQFLDGRCYALLLAVSTLQCVLFARLLLAPSRARAALWCGVAAFAILLQYYALIGAAAQGLVYLATQRGRAARTWPALLAFAPAFGWMAFHWPRLKAFSAQDVAWHPVIGAADAARLTAFAVNPAGVLALVLVVAVLVAAILAPQPADAAGGQREDQGEDAASATHLWLAAGAALVGLALTLLSGMIRPTLTSRYLVPIVPGLLLSLVLCARRSARARLAYLALAVVYLGSALRPEALANGRQAPYGYEQASVALMRHGVTDVVFVWDHETVRLMAPSSLRRVGAAFFRRAGDPARVTALAAAPTEDVNRLALTAATGARPGIIWIYNRNGATSARAFPPAIPRLDPRWTCDRFGDATVGSLACWRALTRSPN
jgi:hypothetical protein